MADDAKPDDIPQDVWDAAVAEVTGDDTRLSLVVISRAILTERARCSKVCEARAERHKAARHQYETPEDQDDCLRDAIEATYCAAAIRNGQGSRLG